MLSVVKGKRLLYPLRSFANILLLQKTRSNGKEALVRHSILPGVKKRKRLKTPPEMIAPGDEAKYIEQEERVAKRMADGDPDYQDTGLVKSSSEYKN
jgi:hypothetical protein